MQQFVPRDNRNHAGEDWFDAVLVSRGVHTQEEREKYLHPALEDLLPPQMLPGAKAAADVLLSLPHETPVVVYGDYDVDGVCAAIILREALEKMGFSADVRIPDRHEEGYGLNESAVLELSQRYRVLITVDCGITNIEEVHFARERGMTVIVTDHHTPGEKLPMADAVVSPLLQNYAFPFLCGAGVAWKLSQLLCGMEFALNQLELCTLATVADLVPLRGENRILVTHGLARMADTVRPGLKALLRFGDHEKITSEDIAFRVAPRLNAAGRMASAMDAYGLLTEKDPERANGLAQKLEELNTKRRNEEMRVLREAEKTIAALDLTAVSVIVVQGEDWDSGVVGLAAGKIAEKYGYPTVVLTRREENTYVGSGRSASGVDLYAALREAESLFLHFGGHRQAAGLTLSGENIPAFTHIFNQAVNRQLNGKPPVRQMVYDAPMKLSELTMSAIEKMALLEPFGMDNPEPVFLFENVNILSKRPVGADGSHLKMVFEQAGHQRDGIFFNGGGWESLPGYGLDVLGVPSKNVFNGSVRLQCTVKAMRLEPVLLHAEKESNLFSMARQAAIWSEFFKPEENQTLEEGDLPLEWVQSPQGTLLLCRDGQTALETIRRFPECDYQVGDASDVRAYTAVGIDIEKIARGYKRLYLCDGVCCAAEINWLRSCLPECSILASPSQKGKAMLLSIRPDKEAHGKVYRFLKRNPDRDLADTADGAGLSQAQTQVCLTVLLKLGHIVKNGALYRVSPSARKAELEENRLYTMLWDLSQEGGA